MNFNEIIDRSGRGAIKGDWKEKLFGTEDVIPMWVADMDFKTPKCILDALRDTLDYGVLGYHAATEDYFKAIIKWQQEQHNMHLEEEWIKYCPGVVTGLAIAINAFTEENDKIVVQTPVYFPFFEYPKRNHRKVVYNTLIEKEGTYMMDFADLEQHFSDGAKMLILCSPHNPAGRIWTREELKNVADLAEKYKVVVIADEIHADLALGGREVVSYATVSEAAANHSMTLIAPSKTFNMAGLGTSVAIIQNDRLRHKWVSKSEAYELQMCDFLGYGALIAAFNEGDDWRQAVLKYLEENVDFAMAYFEKYIPKIKPWRPEASFLMWLDCREMQLSNEDLMTFFVKKAKLGLSQGVQFGSEGSGFMRLNFAVPRSVLKQALEQLKNAFL